MNAVFSTETSAYISSGRGASVARVRRVCMTVFASARPRACVCAFACGAFRAHILDCSACSLALGKATRLEDLDDDDDDDDFNGDEDIVETTLIEVVDSGAQVESAGCTCANTERRVRRACGVDDDNEDADAALVAVAGVSSCI